MIVVKQFTNTAIIPVFGLGKWIPGNNPQESSGEQRVDGSKKVRVIVIDDESVIAHTVVEILNEEGFEATAVANGASAIDLAKDWRPDVVLSDVIMPGLNGIETGMRIRESVSNCRIILFSGQAATVDLLEKARLQGHEFRILAKPIRPEELISAIRSISSSVS
jgi:CheY-like chemotaxis protein